ncbi:MAG TPA: nucleotide pyrophosphohydrolase [Patescibacteria group bacterium]
MDQLTKLQDQLEKFREERDWKQFHNPKDLAISLSLEASEVLEHFQWKNVDEVKAHIIEKKEDIAAELADVLYWLLLLSKDLNVDLEAAFQKKMDKNAQKYPVDKAKGTHKKYTELETE